MKRKIRYNRVAALLVIIAAICGYFYASSSEVQSEPVEVVKKDQKPDPVEERLKIMSLTEKVGQMVMIGVHGTEINDDIKFMLNNYHVGGIIFFDRNMQSQAQVKKFVDDLNAHAAQKARLFIALDEEGGRVSRMKHDLVPPPSQEDIGTGEPADAKFYAEQIAKSLRNIGINVNFAPVADVGSKDTRSFHSDPNVVAEFVSNAVKGYEAENFFCCLKHFPGIGKSKIDPHKDISEITDTKEILDAEDLPPFKKIIAEEDNTKFMIMVSHLKYPALDQNHSASSSPAIMTDLLRNELNFQGVIITDDLEMGATANYNEYENIGVQAVNAGADILLVCHDYDHQQKVYLGVLEAVKRGEIPESRIDDSVRRILRMKIAL